MKKVQFGVLLVCGFVSAFARDVNVADYGVFPGRDSTLALYELIQRVGAEPGVTLVFPKGRYFFSPGNAFEAYRSISNHDNSLKRMVFPLFGVKNMTIDGNGSEFMFHGRVIPFVLDLADGVTLKNFSIDWDRSFHNELKILTRDEAAKSFVAEVDTNKYPFVIRDRQLFFQFDGWEDSLGNNIVFDPDTHAPVYNDYLYRLLYKQGIYAEDLGDGRVRISGAMQSPPPIGKILVTYGVNPTSRLCPAIHSAESRNVTVENVTVYAAGGMAFIAERTENIHLDGFRVTTRGDGSRVVSTRADATHFIGCKGTITIENCLLQHMLDDGVNVHGFYVKVDEYLGSKRFLCSISHPQQWGCIFAEPGDRISLLSRETVLPLFETTVVAVQILNEQRIIVTVADLPDTLPKVPLSVENLTWYPDFVMKHNTVKENRARSVLVSTKGKVLIENNYFSSQMNGILIEGDNDYWYESGGVEDVTIRGNVFENIGFGRTGYYVLYASPMLNCFDNGYGSKPPVGAPVQRIGEGQYHRNIRFVDNTVKSFNRQFVFARSIDGLDIFGNRFEFSTDYPSESSLPGIALVYCDHVNVASNRVDGFVAPIPIFVSKDSEHVNLTDKTGFKRLKEME